MRTVNVFRSDATEHANAIKDVFDQYATGYFSSVTVDTTTESGTAVYVNFYMDGVENPAMKIRISNGYASSSDMQLVYIGDITIRTTTSNSYQYRFYNIDITDNAVVIHTGPSDNQSVSSEFLFVLCKNKQGSPMVAFYATSLTYSSNTLTIQGISASTTNYIAATVSIPDGQVSTYTQYITSNNDNTIMGVPAMNIAGESSNVWIAATRCFNSIRLPFTYTINGESYAGIAYNVVIVKTE